MSKFRSEVLENLGGKRRRTGDKQAHESANLACRGFGQIQKTNVDGRNSEECARPEVEKFVGSSLMLEPLKQAHSASRQQPAVNSVAEAMDVKQRKNKQQAIAAGDL